MGTDIAKQFMTHAPDTETFTKYYEQGTFDLPVFEIAMRADTNLAAAEMDENATAVLTRMIDTTRVKGVFLENAVRKLQRESTELKEAENAGSLEKVRAIKRRIKRAATNSLYNQELKLAAENMTVQEFNR